MVRSAIFSCVLTGVAGIAAAAEVSRDVTVDADAAAVWEVVGPFCAIADWYPGIETCVEEEIDGARHRRLGMADGGEFLEEQLAHDDAVMSYRYAIIEGPLPVKDYEASFSVDESGDQAVVRWESTFEPDGVSAEEATDIMAGVYDDGLEALQKRFAQ
jgi:hypothetical protein